MYLVLNLKNMIFPSSDKLVSLDNVLDNFIT